MRGGVPQRRPDGSRFLSRPVRSVDEEVRLNLRLWRLAAALEKAVTPTDNRPGPGPGPFKED